MEHCLGPNQQAAMGMHNSGGDTKTKAVTDEGRHTPRVRAMSFPAVRISSELLHSP